jgi:Spy/CpxP family protein refolding chaperone
MRRLILGLLVVAAAVPALAQEGPRLEGPEMRLPPGKWWENPRVVERVGLTDAQQRAIADSVYDHALKMIDLKATLEKAELELRDRVDRSEIVADQVRASFRSFQAARAALESERFEMLLAVRQQLSPEQWNELQALHREHRRNLADSPDRRPGRPGQPLPQRPR